MLTRVRRRHILRGNGYLLLASAGVAFLAFPPMSYQDAAAWLPIAWAVLMLAPGLLAAAGCFVPRHRWEWVAAWLMSGGVGIYALAAWGQVMADGTGHLGRAFLLSAFAVLLVSRAREVAEDSESARLAIAAKKAVAERNA